MSDRYNTAGDPQGEYEPGSDNQVLRNSRSITDLEEIEGEEYDALIQLELQLFDEITIDKQITAEDLCVWHRLWLGNIYDWAGDYRTVNISKDDFVFAAAHLIPKLMQEFEEKYLASYTPCHEMTQDQLIDAMALCHIEFIIIHPFREGNGRLGRVLATIMALQADMPLLDFTALEQDKVHYIQAIHAGHAGDYKPMKFIFSKILEFSLRHHIDQE